MCIRVYTCVLVISHLRAPEACETHTRRKVARIVELDMHAPRVVAPTVKPPGTIYGIADQSSPNPLQLPHEYHANLARAQTHCERKPDRHVMVWHPQRLFRTIRRASSSNSSSHCNPRNKLRGLVFELWWAEEQNYFEKLVMRG